MHRIGSSERPDLPLALVVGAGGLGVVVARRMALSHRVLLADIDAARAEGEAERLRGEGCDTTGIACDVTSEASVAALVAAVAARGGFRAYAHVAGLSPAGGDFRAILTVNLHGAARVVAALRPIAAEGGAAVLISSMAAHLSPPPSAELAAALADPLAEGFIDRVATLLSADAITPETAYSLSKQGMNLLARREAAAWGARGARIVSLSPGMIATPMGALEFARNDGKRRLYEHTPLRRECTMLEIADIVEFLASPRAAFITGVDLLADGGLTAAVTSG